MNLLTEYITLKQKEKELKNGEKSKEIGTAV